MPVRTFKSLITYKRYPKNMPFNIKVVKRNIKDLINEYDVPCRFKKYELNIINSITD